MFAAGFSLCDDLNRIRLCVVSHQQRTLSSIGWQKCDMLRKINSQFGCQVTYIHTYTHTYTHKYMCEGKISRCPSRYCVSTAGPLMKVIPLLRCVQWHVEV